MGGVKHNFLGARRESYALSAHAWITHGRGTDTVSRFEDGDMIRSGSVVATVGIGGIVGKGAGCGVEDGTVPDQVHLVGRSTMARVS